MSFQPHEEYVLNEQRLRINCSTESWNLDPPAKNYLIEHEIQQRY